MASGASRKAAVLPDLVPARMVNEFSYCPRLFFLEWVDARWADNPDTVEGRFQHRAVDVERGRAPLPEEAELRRARSVQLSSPDLGLVARIDLIEGDGERVCPVDTKRGSPPAVPERAWEPERVQVCVQGLLLREAGYACDEGVLYFAETRERVVVPFDEALIARTLSLLATLRDVAASDQIPPPLVDSPKCPRCSLVGICLPDETNLLAQRTRTPPRRLMPRDPAHRPLHVTEQGATVGIRDRRVTVTKKKEQLGSVRLLDVSQLNLYGNVAVTTQLMRALFAEEIPVCWFSYGGRFVGLAEGLPGKNVELRRRQVIVASQGGIDVARRMVAGKIRNSRTLLRRNARGHAQRATEVLRDAATEAEAADSFASLLGVEGAAARTYFGAFGLMLTDRSLPGTFSFEGRNRRPPRDAVNCLLSFVYALLVKELTVQATAIGFDPYVGLYHRPRFGRPALALDLAEEFRPLVGDSVVVNMVNNGEVKASDFVVRAGGVSLTQGGRRAVIAAYERRLDVEIRHPVFGYRLTYRRVLDVQARLLAAHLLQEIPAYVPFTTR